MKPILISGIQPTGKLHLGNYLGALENYIYLQNSGNYSKCYFFIADLHSLTEKIDPREKKQQILETAAEVRALGVAYTELEGKGTECTFFLQSAVSAHSELAVILNNLTPFSELRRMTQFKDKSESQSKNINVGLFDYPVLMAADILLYDGNEVPVGEDQLQHLELARTLARKFNAEFGEIFVEPKQKLSTIPRVMSLDDPTKKMSKSRREGCIFLRDSPSIIKEKIMRSVTDSGHEIKYDPKNKPAISNLLLIYSVITGESIESIADSYSGKGYAEFKKDIANEFIKWIEGIWKQKKYLKETNHIPGELTEGSEEAKRIASDKLQEVKEKIGLIL